MDGFSFTKTFYYYFFFNNCFLFFIFLVAAAVAVDIIHTSDRREGRDLVLYATKPVGCTAIAIPKEKNKKERIQNH